jgi:methionyl-tRNA formyltransferase
MKRVVFLGGKEIGFFCLGYLLSNSQNLNIEIVGVLTSGKSISGNSISFNDLCAKYSVRELDDLQELLRIDKVDVIISVQYHKILLKEHISVAQQIAVNLHMAPIPEYRGCNQFSFGIIDNVQEFGTSFHLLEEKIDGGDLLFERRFAVPEKTFVRELYEQTFQESKSLFVENIKSIIDNKVEPVSQHLLPKDRKRGFHLRNEMVEIKNIKADWPIEKQKRFFRATYFPPFPAPVLVSDGDVKSLDMSWYNSV